MLLLERMDLWNKALLAALLHKEQIPVPGPIEIPRPGDEERKKHVISDASEVRAFFARHGGAKHVERR